GQAQRRARGRRQAVGRRGSPHRARGSPRCARGPPGAQQAHRDRPGRYPRSVPQEMTLPRLLLAMLVVALAARSAAAADTAPPPARRLSEPGEKLYAPPKFSHALDEYQKAFDAKPIPDFLFNIGQCYRNLGDYDSAIFSYRKYLTLAPDAPNRPQV